MNLLDFNFDELYLKFKLIQVLQDNKNIIINDLSNPELSDKERKEFVDLSTPVLLDIDSRILSLLSSTYSDIKKFI